MKAKTHFLLISVMILSLLLPMTSMAATSKKITSVKTGVHEQKEDPGIIWTVSAPYVSGSGLEITDYSWSSSYESWKPGQTVSLTMTITSTDKVFDKQVKGSFSGGKVASVSRKNGNTVIMKANYEPSVTLEAPTGVCYDDDYTLTWDKVQYAGGYQIEVKKDNKKAKTITVTGRTTTKYDLSSVITDDEAIYTVRIKATAPKGKSCIKDSDWAGLDGSVTSDGESTVSGKFTGSGSSMTFTDSNGDKASGWQLINGSWYYFDPANHNRAAADKWVNISGLSYHFDSSGRMQTGWYKDSNGSWYFLNNGNAAKELPEGAMISSKWISEGSGGPGTELKWYYFYPDGHMAVSTVTPDGMTVDASGNWINR